MSNLVTHCGRVVVPYCWARYVYEQHWKWRQLIIVCCIWVKATTTNKAEDKKLTPICYSIQQCDTYAQFDSERLMEVVVVHSATMGRLQVHKCVIINMIIDVV